MSRWVDKGWACVGTCETSHLCVCVCVCIIANLASSSARVTLLTATIVYKQRKTGKKDRNEMCVTNEKGK